MLVGDRAKYLGILTGLTFASLLITQQLGIFVGLMTRTYGAITDLSLPDIWVMDPKVQYVDDTKPMQETQLYRVRGVQGVAWAVPLYKGQLRAKLADGTFQACVVIGIDDASLIGGPPEMIEGDVADLRRTDGIIVDAVGAETKLRQPDGPLRVGGVLELNDHRAVVIGICRTTRTFQSLPVLYTTYRRATTFAPQERLLLSFVLVKAKPGEIVSEVCRRITSATGLAAYSGQEFKDLTLSYFLRNTGIPINFGIAVFLGFLVGTIIAGQTFYNFTHDNIRYFGTLKAMGAANSDIVRMILIQAFAVGAIGYGLGVGAASFIGFILRGTELSFKLPWQLLVVSAVSILLICAISALLSIRRVLRLEPAVVFR